MSELGVVAVDIDDDDVAASTGVALITASKSRNVNPVIVLFVNLICFLLFSGFSAPLTSIFYPGIIGKARANL